MLLRSKILRLHSITCDLKSGFGPKALEKLGQIVQNNPEVTHFVRNDHFLSII